MSNRRTTLFLASACVTLLLTTSAVHAQTTTPTPEPGAAEVASLASGTREGWTLLTGEEPAYSVQLPAGWEPTVGEGLLDATSIADETLIFTVGKPTEETDFDAYVTRVEKSLEKRLKKAVPTVFRNTGSGLVARLDQAPGKRQAANQHAARFLFPPCADGARTLTITGERPAAGEDGAPDTWDQIAAAVNPCSAEPAEQLILAPEETELAAAYFELATELNDKREPIASRLDRGGAIAGWTKAAGRFGRLYEQFAPRMAALPWTPETAPLGGTLVTTYRDVADIFIELSRLRTANAINARLAQAETALAPITPTGRAIRLALGLPTVTR